MGKLETLTSNSEEIVTIDELKEVLKKGKPKGYIGFEPSGSVHIGWKICTNKINDFLECGFEFIVLLADWHAYINDKLEGDIEKIKLCGKYMEDCFAAMGVDTKKIKFVYASDYVGNPNYWELVLRTSKATSVKRVKRAMDIMGRSEDEAERDLSKLFYPAMQVSDIFYLDLDVALKGFHRVLNDNGKIAFLEPNKLNPILFALTHISFIKRLFKRSKYATSYTKWELKKILERNGFKNVNIYAGEFICNRKLNKLLESIPLFKELGGTLFVRATKYGTDSSVFYTKPL